MLIRCDRHQFKRQQNTKLILLLLWHKIISVCSIPFALYHRNHQSFVIICVAFTICKILVRTIIEKTDCLSREWAEKETFILLYIACVLWSSALFQSICLQGSVRLRKGHEEMEMYNYVSFNLISIYSIIICLIFIIIPHTSSALHNH